MDIVRQVLDQQVVDRNGREMGRVDGILLELEPNEPPRVAALLIGPSALGHRVHPLLGRLIAGVERSVGIDRDRPAEIDVTHIAQINDKVHLRTTVGSTEVDAIERRVRRWVLRLPASR